MDNAEQVAQVQALVAEQEASGAAASLARRQLRTWNIPPSAENVKLYQALREMERLDGGRVTEVKMREWVVKAKVSAKTTVKYWCVPMENSKDLPRDRDVNWALVDPKSFTSMPPGVDPCFYWFVDQVIPRTQLGRGVFEAEFSIGIEMQNKSRSNPLRMVGGGIPCIGASTAHAQQHDSKKALEPPASSTSAALVEQSSVPPVQTKAASEAEEGEEEDEDASKVFAKIVRDTRTYCDAGQWSSTNPDNPKNVLYWFREYVLFVIRELAKGSFGPTTVSGHLKSYPGIVIKALYQLDTVVPLPEFAVEIMRLKTNCDFLVSNLAQGICLLDSADKLSHAPLDLTFLTTAEKYKFVNAPLFEAWQSDKAVVRVVHARSAVGLAPEERVKFLLGDIESKLPDFLKKECLFGKTILTDVPVAAQLEFLLGNSERFAFLAQWAPASPWEVLKSWGDKGSFKGVSLVAFLEGLQILRAAKAVYAVASPIAKNLIAEWDAALQQAAGIAPRQDVADGVFKDLAVLKLGLEAPARLATPVPEEAHDEEFINSLFAKAAAQYKKISESSEFDHLRWLAQTHKRLKEERKKKAEEEDKKKKEEAATRRADGELAQQGQERELAKDVAPPTTAANLASAIQADEVGAGPSPAQDEGAADQPQKFEVGEEVLCHTEKKKAWFDNKRGVILKLLKNEVEVRLLEGVMAETTKKYKYADVTSLRKVPLLAPPAGTGGKRASEELVPVSEHAGKKANIELSEEEAADLFGDTQGW